MIRPTKKPPVRARARRDNRDKILRAAARLFTRKGYEATTMQDIVKAAGTSIGNAYFYFENKEALAWTLLEEAATSAWAWTDAAVADVSPGPARLAVMVMANSINLLGANKRLTHILLLGAETKALRERLAERFAERIRSYILANVPQYPLEQIDVAVAAWLGAGRNCLEQRLVGAIDGEPRDIAAFLVRWNLRALGVPEAEIDDALSVASRVVAGLNANSVRTAMRSA
ncbi:MAG: TetR/AcrR family transcriptional regulator [Gemmatimonadaceae bacterium]